MDDINTAQPVLTAALPSLQVIRRDGAAVPFTADKISIALTKAFLASTRRFPAICVPRCRR